MWQLLSKINKNLIIAIPVMMVLGFVYGMFFPTGFLKNLIIPLTFLMVYPMMVTLKIKKVFEGGDTKPQVVTQIINFGVVPFVAYGLGVLFFRDQPYMALGLLLAGLVPTSGMTISWTGFARGNMAAAVKMTVIGLTLGSLATPFYVKLLMGRNIDVNMLLVVRQIVVIVFIPMIAGFLTQQALIKRFGQKTFQQQVAPRFPGLSTLGVIGIVFVAIALKARSIAGAPQVLVYILMPLVLLYIANFVLSTIVGRVFFRRGDAIAMVYGSVMRNLSIALAISINAFGAEGSSAALVIAVAYIIQVQSAAWYVKFTDRLFGPHPEKATVPSEPEAAAQAPEALPGGMVPAIKKILYATDLSDSARYAARYACSLGHMYQAQVTILHVVSDVLEEYSRGAGTDLVGHTAPRQHDECNQERVDQAKAQMVERIRRTSVQVTREIPVCPISEENSRVVAGVPVQVITQIAENEDFDLVVVGSHGHGGLRDVMIGSVSNGVLRHCTKPVVVVRLPKA
ncbi:MAG: universal stress protein [Thermodesulfobacteriota bacterium]|nr:universal stress protein [Thermodesulfobacteriota bacterium]